MSQRIDLLKNLHNYVVFVPQMNRPVLRVLIQGKNNNTCIESNILTTKSINFLRYSISSLYRKSKLSTRSFGLSSHKTNTDRM